MTPISLKAAGAVPPWMQSPGCSPTRRSLSRNIYLHGAAPSRSTDPDPCEFIRQKADDAREIARR